MRFRRFVAFWAIAGLVIPIAFLVTVELVALLGALFGVSPGAMVIMAMIAVLRLFLWPTQIMFIGFHGSPGRDILLANAVSVILNIVLYCVLGSVIWCIRSWSRRARPRRE